MRTTISITSVKRRASTCWPWQARGRLISDDHGARAVSRHRYQVRASSTVGVLSELLARGEVVPETVDLYLDTLRANKRMHVALGSRDLLRRDLGPWE